jgi:hypothetical protein
MAALIFLMPFSLKAQTTAPASQAASATAAAVQAESEPVVEVSAESATGAAKSNAGLGDIVKVTLDKVPKDLGDPQKWVLYLDDVAVGGVAPVVGDQGQLLRFYLRRVPINTSSTEAWSKLHRGFTFQRPVNVAVGPPDKPDKRLRARSLLQMVVVPVVPFGFFVVGMIVLMLGVTFMAYKSDLLRDRDTTPPSGDRRPFSLGLSQMAFWFLLVLAAYLYIGLINWDYQSTITTSALALMGISAATGLGAVLIDQEKVTQAKALRAEQATLQSRVAEPPGVIAASAPAARPELADEMSTNKSRLEAINLQVAALPARNWGSRGFLRDVVADDDGISLHRFQILVWTLILGVVFLSTVVMDLSMPEFNATLLSLMGISAGTYLGFKFPEKKG